MNGKDMREYSRQTQFRLIIGALIILFVVGDGLIYIIYGSGAALMGILCLGAGLLPVMLTVLILWFLDWVVKRANQE